MIVVSSMMATGRGGLLLRGARLLRGLVVLRVTRVVLVLLVLLLGVPPTRSWVLVPRAVVRRASVLGTSRPSSSTCRFRLHSASYSNDNIPDETSLRRAYDSWRDFYSNPSLNVARTVAPHYDTTRFENFKANFIALKQANYKAWLKSKASNQPPPPPLQLNEFGDCSAEEYQRFTTSASSAGSPWSSNFNKQQQQQQQQPLSSTPQPPIPTFVNSKTLTPPPTATPWAASTATTNNNNNRMDPSTSYQGQSDGTYSYVPPRNQNMDNTKKELTTAAGTTPTPSSYGATYAAAGGYATTGGMGVGSSYGEPTNGSSSSSSSSSPFEPPSYWSSGPPSITNTNSYYGYNGNPATGTGTSQSYSGPIGGYGNIGGSSDARGMGGGISSSRSPPPPILTPDEQAALDRARSRHEMIPKAVFDEDESEDENTDSTWANFGMPKVKKIRREKMELPPPIINGVGNGGMIGVGPNGNMGNRPTPSTTLYGTNNKSNPSRAVVGNSYSGIHKLGSTTGNGGGVDASTNMYTQDRIRDVYQDWCNNHRKTFEEGRLAIFQKNYLEMEKYSQETGTPLQQLNRYADLSPEEFKAVKTPPSRQNYDQPDWIMDTPESKLESKDEFLNVGPRWGNDPPGGRRDSEAWIDPTTTGDTRDVQGDRRLRLAYQEWCRANNKVFEEARFPIFKSNLVAMEQYCLTQNMPMKPLNEYADLSPTEYQTVLAEKERWGVNGAATPSSFLGEGINGGMPEPRRMPPGMGVMAPPTPYGVGPPPGIAFSGGEQGSYLADPMQQQQYSRGQQQQQQQQGYGSAMAPGGTNMVNTPLNGQGGTIPPVNIVSVGGTAVAGGATPVSEQQQQRRNKKPTEEEFKKNVEARLKNFTEAKNRRTGDGEARLKRFTELKKQVSLMAMQQNVTMEEATQLVFANAAALLEQENASLLSFSSSSPISTTNSSLGTSSLISTTNSSLGTSNTTSSTSTNTTVCTNVTTDMTQDDSSLVLESMNMSSTTTIDRSAIGDLMNEIDAPDAYPKEVTNSTNATSTDVGDDEEDEDSTMDEAPTMKERAIVDLSAVLSIEKNTFQTDPERTEVEASQTKKEEKKNPDDNSVKFGTRSHMHGGRKRHKKPPTQTEHPSAELDASKGEEQLKRAEVAMNNNTANKGVREGQFRSNTPNSTASVSNESHLPECPVKSPDGDEEKEKQTIRKADIVAKVETETKKLDVIQVEGDEVVAVNGLALSPSSNASSASGKLELESGTTMNKTTAKPEVASSKELAVPSQPLLMPDPCDKVGVDERTIEEAKLKAEMEAIQAKLKVFEEARKKAEAEVKEKAAEASRLKAAMKAKHLAAQEAQKNDDASSHENDQIETTSKVSDV